MHDGIESQTKGAELPFLSLPERTPDLAAFAVVNAPAEVRVVELGQDASRERRVVDVMKDVDVTTMRVLPSTLSKRRSGLLAA